MPIPIGSQLVAIPEMLAGNIAAYNEPSSYTSGYNHQYNNYIVARQAGIRSNGSLGKWIAGGEAINAIRALLIAFGMDARTSMLVPPAVFQRVLEKIKPVIMDWVAGIRLPLDLPPANLVNPASGATLSTELKIIYNALTEPGSVTISGGYVAASKTMHCLFPELAPMIDGKHTGISYYNIARTTYVPPLKLDNWGEWLGTPIVGLVNPSPRGAGRNSWRWHQFMAALGVNQHIYELWQEDHGNPGLPGFLAMDPTPGTTGIPRIIDKCLW